MTHNGSMYSYTCIYIDIYIYIYYIQNNNT